GCFLWETATRLGIDYPAGAGDLYGLAGQRALSEGLRRWNKDCEKAGMSLHTAEPPLPAEGCRSVRVDEAATLLGVSRRTVYYRIRDGKLRTVRTRGSQRVLLESVEAL